MKKGIILISLLLFILTSIVSAEFPVHKSQSNPDELIVSEPGIPISPEDKSIILLSEDTEEMEGRIRIQSVQLPFTARAVFKPLLTSTELPGYTLFTQDFFLVFPLPLRAPPVLSLS